MAAIERTPREEAARRAAAAARVLARDARVRLVYLFGSTTDERRAEVRDVDLGVLFVQPPSLDELMRLRATVVEAVGPHIDLVCLNRIPVVLGWEVANTGRCLFARDPDVEVEFVTRARARYWDFKPFLETQWRLTGERLKERLGGASS